MNQRSTGHLPLGFFSPGLGTWHQAIQWKFEFITKIPDFDKENFWFLRKLNKKPDFIRLFTNLSVCMVKLRIKRTFFPSCFLKSEICLFISSQISHSIKPLYVSGTEFLNGMTWYKVPSCYLPLVLKLPIPAQNQESGPWVSLNWFEKNHKT